MICQVFDNKFDQEYLHEIFSILEKDLSYHANNVTNPTTWPYGKTGTHRLFGCSIFHRQSNNRIDYLDNQNAPKFFDMFEFLCHLFHKNYKDVYLQRIDVNLQHSGCDGTSHLDCPPWDMDSMTVMVFPNPVWEKDWGGKFQIFSENGEDLLEEHDYVPGRVIVFPSRLPHRGLGPTKEYVYRYSIVFGVS